MGLIKAAKDALGGLLADQWREYFYCTSLSSDVLMVKGEKQVTEGRNSNTKGNDNIISNGSIVSVNEGQCMIIVDQGKIADFCAEAGEFVYDASSEPSLLYGSLGQNIKNSFLQFGKRFTFGGNTAKDQRVYYFNVKEIMNNLYGTATPIPFRVLDKNTGFDFDTTVRCNGRYSFKIADPLLFYVNVCGNVADEYRRTELTTMMKDELLTAMQPALAKIAMQGVRPYELSAHAELVRDALKEELSEQWTAMRGIEMVTMTINSDIPKEDRERLTKWQDTAMLRNGAMASARQTEAFATAIENMGNGGNGEGGDGSAMNGAMSMMAMGMMQNMMNGGFGMNNQMNQQQMQQPQMNQQMQQPQMQPMGPASTVAEGAILGWTCTCGKTDNRGKFCMECGLPKPALDGWTCSCGHVNQGKFCPECGKKRPEGAPLYKCDKCGWEPEDPTNPPKFCPECGDVFDDSDIK
ncbi:MAG: SPFH domain-containing protein [Lachnospiraceae bacterium]|nr:SPFH domain-containing protein [Lachnospiraceae bacterium]